MEPFLIGVVVAIGFLLFVVTQAIRILRSTSVASCFASAGCGARITAPDCSS
jgi:hypothetical protein